MNLLQTVLISPTINSSKLFLSLELIIHLAFSLSYVHVTLGCTMGSTSPIELLLEKCPFTSSTQNIWSF